MAKKIKKAGQRPRNRAAQDITLINLRALKERMAALEAEVGDYHQWLHDLNQEVDVIRSFFKLYGPKRK